MLKGSPRLLRESPGRAPQSPAAAWAARSNKRIKAISPPVFASTQRSYREAGNTTRGLCASEHSRACPVAKQRNAQAVFPWEGNAAEEPEGLEPRASKEEGQGALRDSANRNNKGNKKNKK
ncbi:hypothetical protein NDU88_004902 [Pleurodeles waltl]|uniref:Uncharacterized protein n=1 Tax=Pleurodeles waltl TaxID=8319 RepID=A0AAV7T9F0_PLEWA|nr:hypothetical protein NDU88_004902 [Pleurodeles waltl]